MDDIALYNVKRNNAAYNDGRNVMVERGQGLCKVSRQVDSGAMSNDKAFGCASHF